MQIEQLRYYYTSLVIWYILNALYHSLDVPKAKLVIGNANKDTNETFKNAADVIAFGSCILLISICKL